MGTVEKILRWYREGAYTRLEAAWTLLHVLDADNVAAVLPTLPRSILFLLHCHSYAPPGQKWFSIHDGEVPGPEPHRLAALAAWFSRHKEVYDAEGDAREKRMERALDLYRKKGDSQPGPEALIAAVRFLDLVAPEEATAATSTLPRDVLWYVREMLSDGPPRIWTNHGVVAAPDSEGVRAVRAWIAEHGAARDDEERARDWQSLTGTWEARHQDIIGFLMPTNEKTRPTDPRWRLTLRADGSGTWSAPDEEAEIAFDIDVTHKYKTIAIRFASGPRRGESARLMFSFRGRTLHLHRYHDGEWDLSIQRMAFEGGYARVEGPPV